MNWKELTLTKSSRLEIPSLLQAIFSRLVVYSSDRYSQIQGQEPMQAVPKTEELLAYFIMLPCNVTQMSRPIMASITDSGFDQVL